VSFSVTNSVRWQRLCRIFLWRSQPLPTPVRRMAILSRFFSFRMVSLWWRLSKNTYPPPPVNAEKFAFFQNNRIPVLASPSLPSGILQKSENLFCQGNQRHHKQISHLASNASLSGLFFNFSLDVKLCGGGEGNRTPVRKPIHTNFSGCRLLFKFPEADGQQSNCPLWYFPDTTAVRKKLPPVVHR